jgi:hypothetical protein
MAALLSLSLLGLGPRDGLLLDPLLVVLAAGARDTNVLEVAFSVLAQEGLVDQEAVSGRMVDGALCTCFDVSFVRHTLLRCPRFTWRVLGMVA